MLLVYEETSSWSLTQKCSLHKLHISHLCQWKNAINFLLMAGLRSKFVEVVLRFVTYGRQAITAQFEVYHGQRTLTFVTASSLCWMYRELLEFRVSCLCTNCFILHLRTLFPKVPNPKYRIFQETRKTSRTHSFFNICF